jgi:nucleoside-diphosphate-sugar epimerase
MQVSTNIDTLPRAIDQPDHIIGADDPILITGASGFIGGRVIEGLVNRGFRNLKCFVRPSSRVTKVEAIQERYKGVARIEIIEGNLLSRESCLRAVKDVALIYHLAAGRGEKSFPDAFANSVVTTRNLLEAVRGKQSLKRFVSISSLSVYSNRSNPRGRMLDESGPIEDKPHLRGNAYTFAKIKQDELVAEYGRNFGLPYVIVRPGVVYGPGNETLTGRAGTATFGFFLHLGGKNVLPLTYVDNCAEAIILAGLKRGVDGEVFNVIDDDLPSSRDFLRLYKKNVRAFKSIYLPPVASYLLCWAWEEYYKWSEAQLPLTFNRRVWHAHWKRTYYTNEKLKTRLGWKPSVSAAEAFQRYFTSCKQKLTSAEALQPA